MKVENYRFIIALHILIVITLMSQHTHHLAKKQKLKFKIIFCDLLHGYLQTLSLRLVLTTLSSTANHTYLYYSFYYLSSTETSNTYIYHQQ